MGIPDYESESYLKKFANAKPGEIIKCTEAEMIAWGNYNMRKEKSDGSSANYYKLPPDANELQDLISYKNLNAQIGEIFRECYRYGQASHSDEMRGIKKILFYAQDELKRLENLAKK
jgi:hypothetical protein